MLTYNVRIGRALHLVFLLALLGAHWISPAREATADTPISTLRQLYGLTRPDRLDRARTALVLVDFQEEFFSGGLKLPDADAALGRAAELLSWARRSGLTVVHVRNVGGRGSKLFTPDGPHIGFMPAVRPVEGELVVTKTMAGGFTKTELDAELRARGVTTIIVSGLMTHLAVDSTVRDGLVLGYHVLLPSDASATRDLPDAAGAGRIDHRTLHDATLAALADRFADVLRTEEVIALPVVEVAM